MSSRLPGEQFEDIRRRMEDADEQREALIKRARDLQKDAKQAIYLAHQQELEKARSLVSSLTDRHAAVREEFSDYSAVGAYNACVEEFCEAAIFVAFCSEEAVPTVSELGADDEAYLGGLSDATGELGRLAVREATKKDASMVGAIRDFIDAVEGEMIQIHLRNGHLRKKYDSIKYNLKKVEELLYELGR